MSEQLGTCDDDHVTMGATIPKGVPHLQRWSCNNFKPLEPQADPRKVALEALIAEWRKDAPAYDHKLIGDAINLCADQLEKMVEEQFK